MADDARFEDVTISDRPLRLKAEGAEDLRVISALMQDAVGKTADIMWMAKRRRLVFVLNRFRWEDLRSAERQHRAYERVQTALSLHDVTKVRARGLDPNDKDMVFAVLALAFDRKEDGSGTVRIMLAGDGEIAAEAECLDVKLADLTQPWQAKARKAPEHRA